MKNTIIKVLSVVMAIVTLMSTVLVVSASAADECKHENYEQFGDPVAATCTEWGFTLYQCSDCKKHYKSEFNTLEKPHNLTKGFEWIVKEEVEATCIANAYRVIVCPVCNEEEIEATSTTKGEHAWGEYVGDKSTCTEAGNQVRTCTVCGKTDKKDDPADGHNWKALEDQKVEPKCANYCAAYGITDDKAAYGSMPYVCVDCGATRTIEIAPTTHCVFVQMEAEADTCDVIGHGKGSFCKWCKKGETATDIVTDTIKHNWTVDYTKEYKSAACGVEGVCTMKCNICGQSYVKTLEALEHDWNEETPTEYVAPTCLKYGYKLYGCTKCGQIFENISIEPTGCDFSNAPATTAATCTEAGGLLYTCKNANCDAGKGGLPAEKLEADPNAPAKGHVDADGKDATYEVEALAPTCGTDAEGKACGTDGYTAGKKCATCGEWVEGGEKIAALKCAYINEVCTVAKKMNVRCYRCGDLQVLNGVAQENVDATVAEGAAESHVWVDVEGTLVPPTCNSFGSVTQECAFCPVTPKDVPLQKTAHEIKKIVEGAECLPGGQTITELCTVCGSEVSKKTVAYDANKHVFEVGANNKAADCKNGGVDHKICKHCGFTVVNNTSALGHDIEYIVAVAPTCTKDGNTAGATCKRCKEVLTASEKVDALGHDDKTNASVIAGYAATCTTDGLSNGTKCLRCGEITKKQEKIAKYDHYYNGVQYSEIKTVAKNCANGQIAYTAHECYYCDAAKIDSYDSVVEHTWSATWLKKEVSCEADGYEYKKCSACGAETIKEGSVVKATGHKNKAGTVFAATCSYAEGFDTKCVNTNCEYSDHANVVQIKHNYVTNEVFPDACEGTTYTLSVCEDCGYQVVKNVGTIVINHDWKVVSAPAEGEKAKIDKALTTVYECKKCGETKTEYVTVAGLAMKTEVKNLTDGGHFVEGTKKVQVIISVRGDKVAFHNFQAKFTYNKTALKYKSAKIAGTIGDGALNGAVHNPDAGVVNLAAFANNDAEGNIVDVRLTGEWEAFITLEFEVNAEVFKDKKATDFTDGKIAYEFGLAPVAAANSALADDMKLFTNSQGQPVKCGLTGAQGKTIEIYRLGDANNDGVVNAADFLAVQQCILTEAYKAEADIDGDGVVKAKDLSLLQKLVVGSYTIKQLAEGR